MKQLRLHPKGNVSGNRCMDGGVELNMAYIYLTDRQCWDSYSRIVTSYILHITLEKSNAIRYILLYFLGKCNIITVTYYILLLRTFHDKNDFSYCKPIKNSRI